MNYRKFILFLIDFLIWTVSYVGLAVISNHTSYITVDSEKGLLNGAITLCSVMGCRVLFKTYSSIWRHANYFGYLMLICADAFGGYISLAVCYLLQRHGIEAYTGLWFMTSTVSIPLLASISARYIYQHLYVHNKLRLQADYSYVAIVGAGGNGTALATELRNSERAIYRPWCFIDVDRQKAGSYINSIKIWDAKDKNLIQKLKKTPVQEIILAVSDSETADIPELYKTYSEAGYPVRIYDFITDEQGKAQSDKRQLRDVKIEDLLFRNQIELKRNEVDYYSGKTVLITGGGGSIGSELCRQIATQSPKKLIIFDIYENNAYEIQQELIRKYGKDLDLSVEIGSVRDRDRLERVFAKHRPDVVFHAAAHKHVPLMEDSACETVKNNVLGTYNTADMAEKYGVAKFVLISTDKAVNPTNVMGASKRMCEMVIQSRADSKTAFAAVRFGNVLGSNGSVIPLFKRQIENGGPVTITDKRIIRYFMTIPEAAKLVITAGADASSGELFVLDMGKPVSILSLAENLIKLSGLRPNIDIEIKEVGLRPGEKLYEELLIKGENVNKTKHPMIFIEHDESLTRTEVDRKIAVLTDAVRENPDDNDRIREAYMSVVPSFKKPEAVNDSKLVTVKE